VRRLIAFAPLKSPVGGKPIYAAIDISAAMAFEEADQILVHDLITLGLLTALTLVAAWFGADIVVLRRIATLLRRQTNRSWEPECTYAAAVRRSELGQMLAPLTNSGKLWKNAKQKLTRRTADPEAATTAKGSHDLNLTITSTLDLTSVLNTFLDEISSLFSSCAASVGWINKQSGALRSSRTATLTRPMKCQTESQSSKDFPW
jgi:hypothetical protein